MEEINHVSPDSGGAARVCSIASKLGTSLSTMISTKLNHFSY